MDTHPVENPTQLYERVMNGTATHDEIEMFVGPDVINEGMALVHDESAAFADFYQWYINVLKPLGVDQDDAWAMFNGSMSIASFVETLNDNQADAFVNKYEQLQNKYWTKVAEGDVI